VFEDRVDRDLVAVYHVEHAVGNPGVLEQFGENQRRAGVLLGWLQEERVPAGHRVRAHPDGNHAGEVERRDAGDDAERLTDRVHVDAGGDLLAERALEQVGDAGRVLDVLEPALHLADGVREHLAVLQRDRAGDVGLALLEELADAEEHVRALGKRCGAPAGQRLLRRLDGLRDFLRRGEIDLVCLLARRRVVHGSGSSRLAGDDLAADPESDPLHGELPSFGEARSDASALERGSGRRMARR
jgi:hypothetical protein